jgi:hypothetical protein
VERKKPRPRSFWRVRLISPSHRGHLIVCFVVVLVGYFGGMYTPGEVAFDGIMEMCHQFGSLFPCEYDESILKACFFFLSGLNISELIWIFIISVN